MAPPEAGLLHEVLFTPGPPRKAGLNAEKGVNNRNGAVFFPPPFQSCTEDVPDRRAGLPGASGGGVSKSGIRRPDSGEKCKVSKIKIPKLTYRPLSGSGGKALAKTGGFRKAADASLGGLRPQPNVRISVSLRLILEVPRFDFLLPFAPDF